jgi:hypothetical protein
MNSCEEVSVGGLAKASCVSKSRTNITGDPIAAIDIKHAFTLEVVDDK